MKKNLKLLLFMLIIVLVVQLFTFACAVRDTKRNCVKIDLRTEHLVVSNDYSAKKIGEITQTMNAFEENHEIDGIFYYSVKPGTDQWAGIGNRDELERLCQIPEQILLSISTEQLIDVVLDYPYFGDVYAFDSVQSGFLSVKNSFNGITELLKRENVGVEILDKYLKTEVLTDINEIDQATFFDISYLEILLAQDEVLKQLNEEDMTRLGNEIMEKYVQKKKYPEIYGHTAAMHYTVLDEQRKSGLVTKATYYNNDAHNIRPN